MLKRFAARFCLALLFAVTPWVFAQDPTQRFEDLATDPQWESYRSRLLPDPPPITRQDFGRRDTMHADGTRGAIGGWIQRSLTPAWFAKLIARRTLNDRLSTSGKFEVTGDDSSSGALFGWFHETSRGWRTPNSLVFRLDGKTYTTERGHGAIQEAGPIIRPDGRAHQWSLRYVPESGQITVQLDAETTTLVVSPEHRKQNASFDRFGLFNCQAGGHFVDLALDDLRFTIKAK